MGLKQIILRAAKVIIVLDIALHCLSYLVRKHGIAPCHVYIIVLLTYAHHIPSVLSAAFNLSCHICTKNPHTVQNILECF